MSKSRISPQQRAFNVLRGLSALPKVSVYVGPSHTDETAWNVIWITHPAEYMPDFKLLWCTGKLHFRVYIHVADTTKGKENAGYCICTLPGSLAVMGFGVLYNFLHKHRANSKSEAVL